MSKVVRAPARPVAPAIHPAAVPVASPDAMRGGTPPWIVELDALRDLLREAALEGPRALDGSDVTPEIERAIARSAAGWAGDAAA